ncbi:hypothetical protein OA92_06695 [Marinomonas sp. SBI22]|uniref:anti-sigma factor n=1 Tax=unclassified Marinomonas TaxID=196814 RepID=UPI0007AF4A6A|nr:MULTISPECIES: hypothetical protein [unclassified Marinomonas]KZM44347.1 hypothetical protein OA92_06695 [Marinomonas sp. SBI22]KZM45505.1 hypothetical protein OA91_07840 [Marinomonas sp. SBI8L]
MSQKLNLALRYQNPKVRSHLASQFVLGTLSPKVKQRVIRLMKIDKELEQAIYQWQSRLEPINTSIDEVIPPKKVWTKLSRELNFTKQTKPSWWQSLFLWRGVSAISFALMLSLFIGKLGLEHTNTPPSLALQGPSYLAVLTSTEESNKTLPELIVSAYKSPEAGQSELHIQWNKNTDNQQNFKLERDQNLTLWTIDKSTGEQVSLGPLVNTNNKQKLSVAQWQLIKNSKELWLTKGNKETDPVLFKGECLQLSSWKTS